MPKIPSLDPVSCFPIKKSEDHFQFSFFTQLIPSLARLHAPRIKRIARGSGWPEHEVKELLKNYKNSKTMMKASKGRQMQGMLRKLGLG